MKKYIFVTPGELSYRPNIDRPEPDFIEMQLTNSEPDSSFHETLRDLIELNNNHSETGYPSQFSVYTSADKKPPFWSISVPENIIQAS